MNQQTEQSSGPSLPVLLMILVGLVVGVILIFTFMGMVITDPEVEAQIDQTIQEQRQEQELESTPAPKFCPDCGDALPESFQWEQFCPYCGEKVVWAE